MLLRGTAFIRGQHVWFSITEPTALHSNVLCINLTSLDEECPDDECQLTNADYAWVKDGHKTAVAFSRAQIFDPVKIEKCIRSGILKTPHQGNVPAITLEKVIAAARSSRELSSDKKALLV